jgi:hypothetical protein
MARCGVEEPMLRELDGVRAACHLYEASGVEGSAART